jgi:hypothetical protein
MKRLTALAASLALLGLAALPGSAGASGPPTTPNGYAGAMNMLQDPTMAPGAGGAMDHANPNGDAGMFHATCVSAGQFC